MNKATHLTYQLLFDRSWDELSEMELLTLVLSDSSESDDPGSQALVLLRELGSEDSLSSN